MATTNNNKPIDMKQVWQQMEPAPTVSSAVSALTTQEDGLDRYIYYLVGQLFYRYDCYGNTWHKLAAPIQTTTTFASMRYSKFSGQYGKVISTPSTSTLRIAAVNTGIFVGSNIRIISGTGAGQIRSITASPDPIKYDGGIATATTSATQIQDTTKKWKPNQWVGYQVRITFGTGTNQVRKCIYNTDQILYLADNNWQPLEPFNSQGFATAPVAAVSHYVIEATDITVNSTWTVNPDSTSRFRVESGGLWLYTAPASGAFMYIQFYDVAGDYWINKTTPTNIMLSAGTDGSIERTGEIGGVYTSGTASAGATYTLTDSSKTWTVDYSNFRIRITGGTGVGQQRRIIYSGTNYVEVARKWDINPDNTSTYEIIADRDKYYMAQAGYTGIFQYDIDSDLVIQGSKSDDGIAANLACKHVGLDTPTIAITSGTRSTGGVLTASVTAPGTAYKIGDIITFTTTGTNGKVIVTNINSTGGITAISVLRPGAGYSAGATTFTGGSGASATFSISTVGTVCNIVTAINHQFQIGEQVVLSGDAAYAGTVTIIGCDNVTNFDIATAAAGNMTAANSNSATLIVDCTKNWTTNEHVGKIIQTHVTGVTGAVQPRYITANTATTITVTTITTPLVNGTGRYVITDASMFGREEQYKVTNGGATGTATGGSTTTLVDSSKTWVVNQWAGYKVRIQAGTGRDALITITSNDATTLTYPSQAFTPDTTTHYHIWDTYGVCSGAGSTTNIVDTTKNWVTNALVGKRLRITGGAGYGLAAAFNEVTITANTATTISFAAVTGLAPDATTTYTVLSTPIRGLAIELLWMYGGTYKGKYMIVPRGGASNTIDRYNVNTELFEFGFMISPQTDTMASGTYYAYDGVDKIYISPGVATGVVQYVYVYDITKNKIYGFGSVPQTQLAFLIGNRMEIVSSPAGIEYLYHMRNTGAEIYRAQIFF